MSQSPDLLFESYLSDLGILLHEASLDAKKDAKFSKLNNQAEESEKHFLSGRAMAYYEVISLMKQQANAFGIKHDRISLDKIDPDKDLL